MLLKLQKKFCTCTNMIVPKRTLLIRSCLSCHAPSRVRVPSTLSNSNMNEIGTLTRSACLLTMNFRDYLLMCEFHIHVLVIAPVKDDY